jgi:hypothetical protein
VDPGGLLVALLRAVDARTGDLERPAGRAEVARRWRAALLFLDQGIAFRLPEGPGQGVLRDACPERGLCVEGPAGERRWLAPAAVREIRPLPLGGADRP